VARVDYLIEIHPLMKDVIDKPISDVAAIMGHADLSLKTDRSSSSISQDKKNVARF